MNCRKAINKRVVATSQAALTGMLCVLAATPQMLFAETPALASGSSQTTPLTQQQKTLHALNRMTFGPRPGDEATVSRIGLEAWFQQQLHPERIDDSAMEQKLDAYPAMRLSEAQLMQRFPSPQMIRSLEKQGGGIPSDPIEHAIYADALANYELNKQKQAAGNTATGVAPATSVMDGADPAAVNMASATPQAKSPDAMAADGQAALDEAMQAPAMDAAKQPKGKGGKGKHVAEPMDANNVEAIVSLPPQQRFTKLVSLSPEEIEEFRAGLKPFQKVRLMQGLTPDQTEDIMAMQGPARVVAAEALESRLMRDVYSQRQLQAVMTDFWLNHFNVYVRKNQNEPYLLPSYQRDTILPNALGTFEDLLIATAQSPAMLMYLDNWQSIGPDSQAATRVKRFQQMRPNGKLAQALPKGINENYARELMELHTLGVNGGGYTQKDVIEVAKCFTGWTIDKPYQAGMQQRVGLQRPNNRELVGMSGQSGRSSSSASSTLYTQQPLPEDRGKPGEFIYEPNRHEPGDKVVLGQTIREGGENEGLQVLHILATSPATAQFVSKKLAVRFVSDDPSPVLVNSMAATFLKTSGDIKAVLTTMFHSPEFWSPKVYRAKVKTPLEFMTSALRASDASVNNAVPLVQAMERLGMPIYGMQTPNGYSWTAEGWVSSNALISRMNFALVLSGDRVPGTRTNWPVLLGDGVSASAPTPATEKQLEAVLIGQPAAENTRATVLAQFNNSDTVKQAEKDFNAKPVEGEDMNDGKANVVRVGLGRKGGGGLNFQSDQPESPLDTMAGLLLGSPDFQRR